MPVNSPPTQSTRNEATLSQNLSKIRRIRKSQNQRLIDLLSDMEKSKKQQLGEDGYNDFLSSAPLETLIRRFSHSTRGSASSHAPMQESNGSDGIQASEEPEDEHDEHDYRYSTDIEQQLLDEKRNASQTRRKEIEEELNAIHASRMRHLANDSLFDEFEAEKAAQRHEASADKKAPRNGDAPSIASTAGRSSGAEYESYSHENDFAPNPAGKQVDTPGESYDSAGIVASSGNSTGDGATSWGAPTSSAEPPQIGGTQSAWDVASGNETRGALDDDEEDRGTLNDGLDDEAAKEEEEARKKQDEDRRKKLIRVLVPILIKLLPIFLVLVAVLFLASCIDQLNPFGSRIGSSASEETNVNGVTVGPESASETNARTRRKNNSSQPSVQVSASVYEMFSASADDEEDGMEEEEEEDGELTDAQKRVIEACHTTPSAGAGWCAAWVGYVFENANVGVSFRGDARDWWNAFCDPNKAPKSCEAGTVKTDPNRKLLKPAMIIAVPSSSSGTVAGATYGHIGIYIGDNKVMHNIGSIATCTVDEWISVYGKYADVGWGWAQGIKLGGSGKSSGSIAIGDALNLHISSQKEIKLWAKKIDKYLAGHGAVRMGFKGEYFAEAAAQYGIDPRLSAAQSCIEQSRGDVINTADYYNLWGWGVYPGSNGLIHTSNARDACFKHAKGLADGYGPSFGPAQVETYCPGSPSYWPLLKSEAEAISAM